MTAIAFVAYALIALALVSFLHSLLCGSAQSKPAAVSPRVMLAGALSLAGFFCVPPGSLPPLWNTGYGAVVFLVFFVFSLLLEKRVYQVMPLLVFAFVVALCAYYAYERGMPGTCFNLASFTAMPLWGIASGLDRAGFFFLFVAPALAVCSFAPAHAGRGGDFTFTDTLRYAGAGALFIVLVLPWNSAPYVAWPDMFVAGFDFILFWLKVFLVCYGFRFIRLPRHASGISLVCCLMGASILILPLWGGAQ
ncbi:hypothetical protein FACS1894206_07280 [Deltaproteobacteria bacterium]|nr:hypothetical protein FACS1894206_07280 [Deltaproteobacteria bacterium]